MDDKSEIVVRVIVNHTKHRIQVKGKERQPIIEYYDARQQEYAEALRAAAWNYLWKAACADKDYDSVAQAQKMLEEWRIPVVNNH